MHPCATRGTPRLGLRRSGRRERQAEGKCRRGWGGGPKGARRRGQASGAIALLPEGRVNRRRLRAGERGKGREWGYLKESSETGAKVSGGGATHGPPVFFSRFRFPKRSAWSLFVVRPFSILSSHVARLRISEFRNGRCSFPGATCLFLWQSGRLFFCFHRASHRRLPGSSDCLSRRNGPSLRKHGCSGQGAARARGLRGPRML